MKKKTIFIIVTILSLVCIIGVTIFVHVINNRNFTEQRARENAQKFITDNNITSKRMTCAGDSDGDGYGTCTIVTSTNEKIQLACPSDFVDVRIFGAQGCKEKSLVQLNEIVN